ncbi:formate dehydrogenase accessory protein FdhE [candidate division KSB1 bacterium]|nr:formate dehydrogenase accessory protein FdhE [candidate division KSB1 bacterium]
MINTNEEQRHFFQLYLKFHEDMMKVQVKNMQYLVAAISFEKLHRIDFGKIIKNGDYVINPHQILVEENDLEPMFERILPIMKKYYQDQKELNRFEEFNDKRKISLKQLMKNVLHKDQSVWNMHKGQYPISVNLLRKIGEYITAPYLELCSEYFSDKIVALEKDLPYCPICGRHPIMAYINDKQDIRLYWCQLCNTEWKFTNTRCPFCLNEDQSKIVHIFPSDNSFNYITACDVCKTYFKVYDGQFDNSKPQLMVENLRTYKLDMLAMSYAYHKPGFKAI